MLVERNAEATVEVVDLVLSEERKHQGDDDGHDGTLTCRDDLTHVDWDLDVRWGGSDDGAVGAVRGVGIAAQMLADSEGWRYSGDLPRA